MSDTKSWDAEHEKRIALALAAARDSGYAKKGSDLVLEVVKTAVDVERRWKVDRGPAPQRAIWPHYNHSDHCRSDLEEILKQRMIDVAAGDPIEKVFNFRSEPTAPEIDMLDSVLLVFPQCMIGKNPTRDWKIVWEHAKGKTLGQIAHRLHIGRAAVWDRKVVQCMAIWRQVSRLMPAAKTGHVFGVSPINAPTREEIGGGVGVEVLK